MELTHPCLAPIQSVAKKTSGETGRICKHRREINVGHRLVDQFIKERLPELASLPAKPISEKEVLSRATELLAEINRKCTRRAVASVWRRFCEFIDSGNAEGHWALPALGRILELPADVLSRDAKWQNHAVMLRLNDQVVLAALESYDFERLDARSWIGLIIYFAATRSGLAASDAMCALVDALANKTPFARVGDDVYMPLPIYDAPYTNAGDDNRRYRLQRLWPDTLTLSLVKRFYDSGHTLDDENWNRHTLRGWVNRGLRKIDRRIVAFDSIAQLGRVALSIEELHTPIPQIYLEASWGRNQEAALPESYWRLLNGVEPPPFADWGQAIKVIEPVVDDVSKLRRHRKSKHSVDEIYTALYDAVRKPKEGVRSNPKTFAIEHLKSLKTDNWPLAGQMLCAWGLHHLEDRNNAVGTLRTYFSTYGKGLLLAMHDQDAWDPDDLFDVYQAVIQGKDNDEFQFVTARRLTDFHTFARARFDLPGLLEPLTDGLSSTIHVRAAYIPEHVFRHGLSLIPKLEGRSKHYYRQLQLLWVLAYRCGLRRNELIRLQVRDVESSREMWLFIRNNVIAKGKTTSARRKVPLAALLTREELELFRKHLAACRKRRNAPTTLVLAAETGVKDPLNPSYVSADIVRLFEALGVRGSLHSLRHTALSRLQLVAEREWALLPRFTPYSQADGERIYEAVFDHPYVRHERYRALAVFAGHASPGMTLSTYLHFSELIIHERLKRSTQRYSRALISNVTGFSKKRLIKLARAANHSEDEIPTSLYRSAVIDACRSVISDVRSLPPAPLPKINLIALATPELTLARIYDCLDAYQRGAKLEHLPYEHGIPLEKIQRYIDNAIRLAQLTTQKGNPRLIPRHRQRYLERPLLPSRLNHRAMQDDAEDIKRAFGARRESHSHDIAWTLVYFLTHTTTTEPYITFKDPTELERFLRTCDLAISKRRWRIEIIASPGESAKTIRQKWKIHAQYKTKISRSSGPRRGDRARLYYCIESEPSLVAAFNETSARGWKLVRGKKVRKTRKRPPIEHYSASTLRHLFHILAICWLTPQALAKYLAEFTNTKNF